MIVEAALLTVPVAAVDVVVSHWHAAAPSRSYAAAAAHEAGKIAETSGTSHACMHAEPRQIHAPACARAWPRNMRTCYVPGTLAIGTERPGLSSQHARTALLKLGQHWICGHKCHTQSQAYINIDVYSLRFL